MINKYIRLLRFSHYVKNLFLFLPLFFSIKIFDLNLLLKTFLAFIAFSAIASSLYIFNDWRDMEEDRRHFRKRNRPLASGEISIKSGFIFGVSLFILGLTLAYLISYEMIYLVLIYLGLNILYSTLLKQVSILDIIIIAIGFVIRILIGGVINEIKISMWLIVMTFLLALFIALGKRREDVIIFKENDSNLVRKSIHGYNLFFLDYSMIMLTSIIVVSYIMYSISPEVVEHFKTDKLYLTTLFVIMGVLRYLQIAFVENKTGSPVDLLFEDRFIQISIVGWVVTFYLMIYY